jgi:single-strand DNA-binding protein
MNNINLIGRITKDIELRYTSGNNTAVAGFTIAVDDGFGDKKKTYFINCQSWQKTAENISKYFAKCDLIGISGKLTTRSWEGTDGKKNYVTEVVVNDFTFCNGKKTENQQNNSGSSQQDGFNPTDDDELPF